MKQHVNHIEIQIILFAQDLIISPFHMDLCYDC